MCKGVFELKLSDTLLPYSSTMQMKLFQIHTDTFYNLPEVLRITMHSQSQLDAKDQVLVTIWYLANCCPYPYP